MAQTETYFDNGDLLAIVDDGNTYAVVLSTLTDDYDESSLVLEDTPSLKQATRTYDQTITEYESKGVSA